MKKGLDKFAGYNPNWRFALDMTHILLLQKHNQSVGLGEDVNVSGLDVCISTMCIHAMRKSEATNTHAFMHNLRSLTIDNFNAYFVEEIDLDSAPRDMTTICRNVFNKGMVGKANVCRKRVTCVFSTKMHSYTPAKFHELHFDTDDTIEFLNEHGKFITGKE